VAKELKEPKADKELKVEEVQQELKEPKELHQQEPKVI
jgi:hypothetical protein